MLFSSCFAVFLQFILYSCIISLNIRRRIFKFMNLDKRLKAIYDFIDDGEILCDVGCDHSFLPIYAIKEKKIPLAFASDIGKGPLESAKNNAKKYNINSITHILSNGFDSFSDIQKQKITTVCIAGMGGILITDIISRAPFLKDERKTLILQPMKAGFEMLDFLFENGFKIIAQVVIKDHDKFYNVYKIKYCSNGFTSYFGGLKYNEEYFDHLLKKYQKQKNGILKSRVINSLDLENCQKMIDIILSEEKKNADS